MIDMSAVVVLLIASAPSDDETVSCGVSSTLLFLREHQIDISLDELARRVPDRSRGNTFTELRDVCSSLGADASIVNVKGGNAGLPTGPFVAHLNARDGGEVGHFVFLRPLEPTFTQYQLIAPPLQPAVVDAREWMRRPDFEGWVLTVEKPTSTLKIGLGLAGVGIALTVFAAPSVRQSLFRGRTWPKLTPAASDSPNLK